MKTLTQQLRESIDNLNELDLNKLSKVADLRGTTRADREEIAADIKKKQSDKSSKEYINKKEKIKDYHLDDLPVALFNGKNGPAITPEELYQYAESGDVQPIINRVTAKKNFKSPFLKTPELRDQFNSIVSKNANLKDLFTTYLTDALEGENVRVNQANITRFYTTAEKQFEALVLKKKQAGV